MTHPKPPLPGFLLAAALGGAAPATAQAPAQATPSTVHRKVYDARAATALAWKLNCRAPGAPDILAGMEFAKASALSYRIARVEYNDAGREVLENGRGLPRVKSFYDRYVAQQKPISRPVLHSALWAWKTFGSRFRWGDVTYQCQFA